MYIGKASELTGATPKAIRHYEAIGLITPPRRLRKYRYYSGEDLKAIRMIKHAQQYGFKLSELETIIAKARSEKNFPYDEIIEAIEKKRKQIRLEIRRLTTMDEGLTELRDQIISQGCSC
jgi:MerR family transcriptional regulator, copper efflux regulator